MATPVRKSMRTRKTKRPASPSEDEERRKKKQAQAQAAADPPVDVVTVTTTKPVAKPTVKPNPKPPVKSTTTKPTVKTKASIPSTRQSAASSTTSQGKAALKISQDPLPTTSVQQKPVPPVRTPTVTPPAPVVTIPEVPKVTTPPKVATPPKAAIPPAAPVEPVVPKAEPEYKGHCFKDPNFVHSSKGGTLSSRKSRVWKSLKQITAAERSLPWKQGDATYSSCEAPPSFKPAKKYSDLSGFQAKYTDPHTKLRYATTEEFARLRMLPQDIVTGLLALRKANTEVA